MWIAPLHQLPLWDRDDTSPEWRVRESARARRLSVRVFRDGAVEVVVPRRTRPDEVARFVARHRPWIERQRRRCLPAAPEAFPPRTIALAATAECWSCACTPGQRAPLMVVAGALRFGTPLEPPRLRAALRRWLAVRALAAFAPPLATLAAGMGVAYRRLQVRRQRTRWGSCSTRGTISLNCCLLFQQPDVVRYLMVHELAHLMHPNHSARFWRCVARFEPRWRELDRELLDGWRHVPRWALA
jgi:predicted metal-dependent hydrolase